tara:strand:+ start:2518 stop:4356 length:1839 start_codon:yes stop_codon:yes gene_type:complete
MAPTNNEILNEADAIPGYRGGATKTTSAGKSFINTVIAKMPFSYQVIENISSLNPKYETFSGISSDRSVRVGQQSVFKSDLESDLGVGSVLVDKNFQQFMYANLDLDKVKRLQDYRKMSGYSTLADCLDEICDEVFVEDKDEKVVILTVKGEYSKTIEDEIEKEWMRFVDIFEFEDKGWQYVRNMLIDGELFFENVISQDHPEFGIIGAVGVPTELINPFYKNAHNDIIDGFALRRPKINDQTEKIDQEELVIFQKNQVTYFHSGQWNEDRSMRLPYIENARRAYKQLSLVEDSIVIYRLVRAPERMAFHVDVGNMSPPKAEAYIKKLMQQYWAKKSYDTTSGRVTNVYDPQSMMDSYWFPKRAGTEGTRVERLEGGHNLGSLDDLLYFLRNLYKSMKVPVGRINPDDVYKDGTEMTREELRFAKFLIRLQKQIASGLKESFITHLKLRNIWDAYNLKERNLKIVFNTPTMFMMMKQQQMFELQYNNFNNLSQNEGISNSFAQKEWLDFTDESMATNREWRRKDAAMQYELEQILTNGPNWKQQVQAMQDISAEMEAGGGGMGGAVDTPPDFGPAPDGAEAPPEGAPAPAEGAAPPEGGQAPAGAAVPPPVA